MKIAVVGGGAIGLGIAGELASDHEVTLFERGEFAREASHAAAGMLGPIMEVEYNEPEQLSLNQASHEIYPSFINELEDETGVDTGFRTEGTFMVASSPSEIEEMDRLFEYQKRIGLEVERISVEECRTIEPRISNYVSKAIYTKSDYQVDNRQLCEALLERCRLRGVELRDHEPVKEVRVEEDRVSEIISSDNHYEPDLCVIAAGAWSGQVEGLPEPDQMPIRPVKGQALSVALSDPPEIEHVVRGPGTYCVPKADGRMVIGSTMEEEGYDKRTTAGGVLDLLHKAYEILPFIYENELLESWANVRPASRDSLPVIGPSEHTDNLLFATGHYRNGILLTPITIQLIADWIRDGEVPSMMEPFLPSRYQGDEP
jgi:glycine oxidase